MGIAPSHIPVIDVLSKREAEVVEAVFQGLNNAAIAAKLGISLNTVKTHLQHIFKKLEVSSKTELILKYFIRG